MLPLSDSSSSLFWFVTIICRINELCFVVSEMDAMHCYFDAVRATVPHLMKFNLNLGEVVMVRGTLVQELHSAYPFLRPLL